MNDTNDSVFAYNVINTSGGDGAATGFTVGSVSARLNISFNNITTLGPDGYGVWIYLSKSNNISGNRILTFGTTGKGIYITYSNNTAIFSNNITTYGGDSSNGIQLGSDNAGPAHNATAYGNLIITYDASSRGILLDGSFSIPVTHINITQNNITTNGTDSYGIAALNTHTHTLSLNRITTSGTGAFAIRFINTNFTTSSENIVSTVNTTAYGIDFAGGQFQEYKFEKPIEADVLRAALEQNGIKDAIIQQFEKNPENIIVRTSGDTYDNVVSTFKNVFPDNVFEILRIEKVGPVVGKNLRHRAVLAIIFALAGILVFVGFRFKHFDFAAAGVIALIHDVFVSLGIVVMMGREIDLLVITALLTIAGYSINDTIIIDFRFRNATMYFAGIDIQGPFPTVKYRHSDRQPIRAEFVMKEDTKITSYWPSTGVKKADLMVNAAK